MPHIQLHSWNIWHQGIFCLLLFYGTQTTGWWAKAESTFMDVKGTAWWHASVSVPLRSDGPPLVKSRIGVLLLTAPGDVGRRLSAQFVEDKRTAQLLTAGRTWALDLELATGLHSRSCPLSVLKWFQNCGLFPSLRSKFLPTNDQFFQVPRHQLKKKKQKWVGKVYNPSKNFIILQQVVSFSVTVFPLIPSVNCLAFRDQGCSPWPSLSHFPLFLFPWSTFLIFLKTDSVLVICH